MKFYKIDSLLNEWIGKILCCIRKIIKSFIKGGRSYYKMLEYGCNIRFRKFINSVSLSDEIILQGGDEKKRKHRGLIITMFCFKTELHSGFRVRIRDNKRN